LIVKQSVANQIVSNNTRMHFFYLQNKLHLRPIKVTINANGAKSPEALVNLVHKLQENIIIIKAINRSTVCN
jgi:hypothetical protein